MQFIGRALLASVFVLGACAGGDKNATKTDSSTAMSSTTTTTTTTPAARTDSSATASRPVRPLRLQPRQRVERRPQRLRPERPPM